VSRSKGEGIGLLVESFVKKILTPEKTEKPPCSECIKKVMHSHFVSEANKAKVLNNLEFENS